MIAAAMTERDTRRLASAMRSSNLAMTDRRIGDADYVAALGMVGIHERVATSLWRLVMTLDARSYPDALAQTMGVVRALDRRLLWRLSVERMREVAEQSLGWLLAPVCRVCEGRRYQLIAGTPKLSNVQCKACAGSGLAPCDSRYVWEVSTHLARTIDRASGDVGAAIRLKVGRA